MKTINIDKRTVGSGQPVFLIGEVGLAHDGSLGAAHAYIDAGAEVGLDAIKFQTHIAAAESTNREPFRAKVFSQDATRFEYWERTGFTLPQWKELATHAKDVGLVFLSSPFSPLAVDWLVECGVSAWKVASGEVANLPLLEKMADTDKPLLVSSGMSSWEELDDTIYYIQGLDAKYGVFQCTTSYPCPPEKWGLNILKDMLDRYDCPVGLSDHSGSIVPSFAAVVKGASMLEFHITFDKAQFGPDVPASLTFDQVRDLAQGIRDLETAAANPVDKDVQARELQPLRDIFTKSVVAAIGIRQDEVFTQANLACKKPGTGIPAARLDSLIGRLASCNYSPDEVIRPSELENEA